MQFECCIIWFWLHTAENLMTHGGERLVLIRFQCFKNCSDEYVWILIIKNSFEFSHSFHGVPGWQFYRIFGPKSAPILAWSSIHLKGTQKEPKNWPSQHSFEWRPEFRPKNRPQYQPEKQPKSIELAPNRSYLTSPTKSSLALLHNAGTRIHCSLWHWSVLLHFLLLIVRLWLRDRGLLHEAGELLLPLPLLLPQGLLVSEDLRWLLTVLT